MSIKYLIVDDERMAHSIIKKYCDMLPNMVLMKNCYDAIEALEYLRVETVDLIFLDLNMPKLKGFEFLKTLSNPPKVIVTTAYKEYALEGYELNIADYLLKPFSFERFLKAVNKATQQKSSNNEAVVAKITMPSEKERIIIRSNKKYIQIAIADLLGLEASGNYVKIILKEETITIREKLSVLIAQLPNKGFLQIHRSFVVALKHIKRIEGNQVFITNDLVFPIGKMYKGNVLEWLK